MKRYELLMECRAGVRHAFRTIMIIKLPDGTFKLHKVCSQCKSVKFPIWNARGQILSHRLTSISRLPIVPQRS